MISNFHLLAIKGCKIGSTGIVYGTLPSSWLVCLFVFEGL